MAALMPVHRMTAGWNSSSLTLPSPTTPRPSSPTLSTHRALSISASMLMLPPITVAIGTSRNCSSMWTVRTPARNILRWVRWLSTSKMYLLLRPELPTAPSIRNSLTLCRKHTMPSRVLSLIPQNCVLSWQNLRTSPRVSSLAHSQVSGRTLLRPRR